MAMGKKKSNCQAVLVDFNDYRKIKKDSKHLAARKNRRVANRSITIED
jgi:hypothetical protein